MIRGQQFNRHSRGSAEHALRASGYSPLPDPYVAPAPVGPKLPSGNFTTEEDEQSYPEIRRSFMNLAVKPTPSVPHLRRRHEEELDRLGAALDMAHARGRSV